MDHNITTAQRHHDQQEASAEAACAKAALSAGIAPERAEQCDDGECCCPTCPWRATSGKWERKP